MANMNHLRSGSTIDPDIYLAARPGSHPLPPTLGLWSSSFPFPKTLTSGVVVRIRIQSDRERNTMTKKPYEDLTYGGKAARRFRDSHPEKYLDQCDQDNEKGKERRLYARLLHNL